MVNKLIISSILIFLLAISFANAADVGVGFWKGYASMSGSLAADGTYVTAHINNASAAASSTRIGGGEYASDAPSGYFSLGVECSGNEVTFKICGISTNIYDTCDIGVHYNGTTPNFNISVTKLSNGVSCSYSCACSGNYCCSGATEYTDGSGTGTCQNSACSAPAATTAPATGVGGGGGAGGTAITTTTVVTTTAPVTTAPAVTTTKVTTEPKVTTIPPIVTTIPRVPLGIELSTIQIVGIIVGVVVILFLIVFLFVRFQAVKMAT